MRTCRRLLSTTLIVAVMLAATGSATAARLSLNEQPFQATWARLRMGDVSGLTTAWVECPVTLEGSFHSATLAKVARSLVGLVTRANLGTCTNGSATLLIERLPWHLRYRSFSGTLPRISAVGLALEGLAARISVGITCLFITEGEQVELSLRLEAAGTVTGARLEGFGSAGVCGPVGVRGEPGSFRGVTRSLVITLI